MKKIFLVVFSLIMMCSVSFGLDVNLNYLHKSKTNTSSTIPTMNILNYTQAEINAILYDMTISPTNEEHIENYETLLSDLDNAGIKYVAYKYRGEYWLLTSNPEENDFELAIGIAEPYASGYSDKLLAPMNVNHEDVGKGCFMFAGRSNLTKMHSYGEWSGQNYYFIDLMITDFLSANIDVYLMTKNSPNSSSSSIYWDGESYVYKHTSSGGDTGDIPEDVTDFTDEQIAEIVERFINSEAYFGDVFGDDYFITYDNLTGYFRGYSYDSSIDLAVEYGNYDEEGNFVTTGTKEGEAWQIRPYVFEGNVFNKLSDWLSSKFNIYSFRCYSISPDSSIEPRWLYDLQYNYCSNYKENEFVIYSTKQIRYVGEKTNSEGKTETEIIEDYIPKTVLKDSETGEEIIIRDNLQNSSDNLENIITPNADFSGLKQAFEKYISFIDISSITWLTTAISSMITIFVPFVALGIIIFLINRILNGGS